jgi:hypothetical protein
MRQNFEKEAVKIAVSFFGRPRIMREWTFWKSRPPLKRKRGVTGTFHQKRTK